MSRPKKGEKGCEESTKKWRKTMLEKYGGKEGLHKRMQEMGAMGGVKSKTGGFASNKKGDDGLTGKERASLVGAIGGHKSSRLGVKNGEGKSKKNVAKKEQPKKKGFLSRVFGGK